jgi:hypothetical protein
MVNRDDDSSFNINHIIEHTSLITSLLRIYPHSADQKGLQEEISMMVSMQNQHITKWIKSESQSSCKQRNSSSDSAVSLANIEEVATTTVRHQKKQDDALRQVFSASAEMWQDGTGHGVADVFATTRNSSPAVGIEGHRRDVDEETAGVDKKVTAIGFNATSPGSMSSPTSNTPGQPTKFVEKKRNSSISVNKPTPPNDEPVNPSLDESTKDDQIFRPNTPSNKFPSLSPRHSKTPSPSPSRVNSSNGRISTTERLDAGEQAALPTLVK